MQVDTLLGPNPQYFNIQPINSRYGECLNLTEFVTPDTLTVRQLASTFAVGREAFILDCYKWVIENVRYNHSDTRRMQSPTANVISEDFWELPAEVLSDRKYGGRAADCDGQANLLGSLLRTRLSPDEVYVTLGNLHKNKVGGHAWCDVLGAGGKWYLLEATRSKWPENPWVTQEQAADYEPILAYNDKQIWVRASKTVCFPMGHCHVEWLNDYLCDCALTKNIVK